MMHFRRRTRRILVVDADREILDQVATVLGAEKYEVVCCTTAKAAMADARESSPDLVIADLRTEDCNGTEFCERFRRMMAPREVPMMFLSRNQIPDVIRRSDSFGGAYHLRKPFESYLLLELIETALQSAGHRPAAMTQPC